MPDGVTGEASQAPGGRWREADRGDRCGIYLSGCADGDATARIKLTIVRLIGCFFIKDEPNIRRKSA